jgi:DNA-binding transcriptional LysR family regulator
MARINIDHLRTLIEVARHGNFTRAGNHLRLTQSAISLQIRELERRFDVQLVERLGRRAHPTEAGLALIEHANRVGKEIDAMEATMERFRQGSMARVRLGTSTTTLTYLLAPVLRELQARETQIRLLVTIGTTGELLEQVRSNDLDLAVVTLPVAQKQFTVTPIFKEELKAIFPGASQGLPPTVTAQFMSEQFLIVDHRAAVLKVMIEDWFASQNSTMRPAMELEHLEAIRGAVAAGLGAAIVPSLIATEFPKTMSFEVRSLKPKVHRTIGVVHRSDKDISTALQRVIQSITTGIKSQAR